MWHLHGKVHLADVGFTVWVCQFVPLLFLDLMLNCIVVEGILVWHAI